MLRITALLLLCLGLLVVAKGIVNLIVLNDGTSWSLQNLKPQLAGKSKIVDLANQDLRSEPKVEAAKNVGDPAHKFFRNLLVKNDNEYTPEEIKQAAFEMGMRVREEIDGNPYTGSLLFLKGRSPDQEVVSMTSQFEGDGVRMDLTHLALVINPGKKLKSLLREIRLTFNRAADKVFENSKVEAWELGNGFVFWVQRLTEKQIKDDPLLADIGATPGAVRIGRDFEIH